jgi:serine/threonine-protein kinase
MVANRYRIHGLLGRGGMGEVYRADDLKLGQNVALKFLPRDVEKDGARRTRFLNEVKIARQISHANVCRVYDVGDVEGRHFLSMEYVDGEDLAALLRRIGHIPKDKAVQIARQLCAGLAAAHEQGVLHRDLKPANVMIDGRGRAKITDFGLAVLGEGGEQEYGAGTPAYMAPEQLAGGAATVKSDLYALGLVLYELFTGHRPFSASAPQELARLQRESTPTNPSIHIDGFDPAVERVILRCLRADPKDRPPTAMTVAAALPGGDPLAAALAAGETPSPEMIAAAGAEGALSPPKAWTLFGATLALLIAVFGLARFTMDQSFAPFPKSPDALEDRARELIRSFGYTAEPTDSTSWWERQRDYLAYRAAHEPSTQWWPSLSRTDPHPWRFWTGRVRFLVPETLTRNDDYPPDRSTDGNLGHGDHRDGRAGETRELARRSAAGRGARRFRGAAGLETLVRRRGVRLRAVFTGRAEVGAGGAVRRPRGLGRLERLAEGIDSRRRGLVAWEAGVVRGHLSLERSGAGDRDVAVLRPQ